MQRFKLIIFLIPFFSFSQEEESLYDILNGNVYETNLIVIDKELDEVIDKRFLEIVEFELEKGNWFVAEQITEYSSVNYYRRNGTFELKNNMLFLKGDNPHDPLYNVPFTLTESPLASEYHLKTELTRNGLDMIVILQLRKSFLYQNKKISLRDLTGTWQLSEIGQGGERISVETTAEAEQNILKKFDKSAMLTINKDGSFVGFDKKGDWTLSKSGYFLTLINEGYTGETSIYDALEAAEEVTATATGEEYEPEHYYDPENNEEYSGEYQYNEEDHYPLESNNNIVFSDYDKIKTFKVIKLSPDKLSIVLSGYSSNITLRYTKKK